jgi:hypothetical protein
MNYFLTEHVEMLYDYSLEFDDELLYRYPESITADYENKLTLSRRSGMYSSTWTYFKWNGIGEVPPETE